MWQTITAVVGILTFVIGVPGVFILVRRAVQSPVRDQLAAMEKDRDFYRKRAQDLEDELRDRGWRRR